MTFAVVSVHSPKLEFRDAVLDSMKRYSVIARQQPGFVWTGVVDDASEKLVGVAVWESEQAADEAYPALMAGVGADPFATWDIEPIRSFRGTVH